MLKRVPIFPLAVAILAAASVMGVRGQWPWHRLSDVPTASPVLVSQSFRTVRDTLQRGESVSTLLARQGVKGLNLAVLATALRFDPRRIKAGLEFLVQRDAGTNEATHVEFRPNADERLRFIRTSAGEWRGESVPIHWATDTIRVAVDSVGSNLYEAIDREVGENTLNHDERTKLVYDLAEVNAYTVDFSRDLQPGDKFAAIVERQISEEGAVRFRRTLASQMQVNGKTYQAFGYADHDGNFSFYDASGAALKRAFLMSPVDFRYISSGFSLARLHPILGLFRKHEGIDFVAPTGSPVRAAGEGTVTVAGKSGGYGNLVEIRHSNGIVTRYGHLSHISIGVHPGTRVAQGQVVGEVGMTGLATGPHLHYEFRVNGVARNPRSVKMDAGKPLPTDQQREFQRRRAMLAELLAGNAVPVAPQVTD